MRSLTLRFIPAILGVAMVFSLAAAPAATAQAPETGRSLVTSIDEKPVVQPRNASGCDWAPGAIGSTHCFRVYGLGLTGKGPYVEIVYSEYGGPASGNICTATAEFKYHPAWAVGTYTRTEPKSGCMPGMMAITWKAKQDMKVGSDICGRQKNNKVSGYLPWICHRIGA